ncbi:hypothetical protein D3C79_682320 [compost metagenome]
MHVSAQGPLRVQAIRRRHLADRQQHFLDLDPWLRGLDRIGRVLDTTDAGVEQAFAPRLDMPTGLHIEHRTIVKAPAAEHISIEELAAPAAVILGVAGELVVVAGLVDRAR